MGGDRKLEGTYSLKVRVKVGEVAGNHVNFGRKCTLGLVSKGRHDEGKKWFRKRKFGASPKGDKIKHNCVPRDVLNEWKERVYS